MPDTIESKKPWSFKVYSQFIQNTTHELRKRGKRLRELSFEARCLYIYLSSFASKNSPVPFPSMATIRFDTGWGISTIKKYRRELQDAGLLELDQRKENGRWRSNLYTLRDPILPTKTFSSAKKQPATKQPAKEQPAEKKPTKKYQYNGRSAEPEKNHEVENSTSSNTGPSATCLRLLLLIFRLRLSWALTPPNPH
jgi:hypothetical protein